MKRLKMRGKPKNWETLSEEEKSKWDDERRIYGREWLKRQKSKMPEDGAEWFTPQQVANIRGVSKRAILKAIKLGEIKASCYNSRVFRVHKSSIPEYAATVCSEVVSDATAILAALMAIPEWLLRRHPELAEAKREQIKILRELKPKKHKTNAQESK